MLLRSLIEHVILFMSLPFWWLTYSKCDVIFPEAVKIVESSSCSRGLKIKLLINLIPFKVSIIFFLKKFIILINFTLLKCLYNINCITWCLPNEICVYLLATFRKKSIKYSHRDVPIQQYRLYLSPGDSHHNNSFLLFYLNSFLVSGNLFCIDATILTEYIP